MWGGRMCMHAPLPSPAPTSPKLCRLLGEGGWARPASRRRLCVIRRNSPRPGLVRDPEIPTEANDVNKSIKLGDDEPHLMLEIPTLKLNLKLKSCTTKTPTENPLTCLACSKACTAVPRDPRGTGSWTPEDTTVPHAERCTCPRPVCARGRVRLRSRGFGVVLSVGRTRFCLYVVWGSNPVL